METELQRKHKVTTHLRELLKLDVNAVQDVCNWLEKNAVKPRDIANRTVSKRMLARMIAAQLALKAAKEGDVAAAKEVMDRTEGKVAQVITSYDGNKLVEQLEAARQRVLNPAYNPPTQSLQAIEGEVVTTQALDQQSSEAEPGEATPQGANPVPSGGVEGSETPTPNE